MIYPPVQVEAIRRHSERASRLSPPELETLARLPRTFVLGASRLIEYKRLDKVIEVGRHLRLPVVIAGSGPDEKRLTELARETGTPAHFLGRVSTPVLHELYRRAALFVFLAIEDFGIMPVEAMAAETPVLVNALGGAREAVELTGGGVIVDLSTPPREMAEAAVEAVGIDMSLPATKTDDFSVASFRRNVQAWLRA
ncbi:glycosyltransferase [Aeromicrobium wangtongii]|uniref:glycosyltransferase n=1 Tax=Aeromicrobium wangtongii TaxID=2969247 RepID=UPI0020170D74|nr:glycosyltransferase [Aeromicrobium wangtongii]MCL3817241.1 glycosyltransferase [Aeromicrobium wangtongii]